MAYTSALWGSRQGTASTLVVETFGTSTRQSPARALSIEIEPRSVIAPLMALMVYLGTPIEPINRDLLRYADWGGMLSAGLAVTRLSQVYETEPVGIELPATRPITRPPR